jgi:pantoate--beta-alanine ligase
MQVIRKLPVSLPRDRGTIGFVPTMGYLHEGHLSLIRRCRSECDVTVMSIFVNPLQFGPGEDYDTYPRDEKRDLEMAEKAGVDYVFMPDVQTMYPRKPLTKVSVSKVTERLCGASRPGHFDGVATVVTKLFNLIRPDRAYFGLKDAQQVAVIRQMVDDLNIPVTIVPCPTVRESDGLALSSRNVRLSPEERKQAPVLYESLRLAERRAAEPGMTVGQLKSLITEHIGTAPLAVIDYVEVARFPSLETPEDGVPLSEELANGPLLAALAVKFGQTRLIDNILLGERA